MLDTTVFVYIFSMGGHILESWVRRDSLSFPELKIDYLFESKAAMFSFIGNHYRRSLTPLAQFWSSRKIDIETTRYLFLDDDTLRSCYKKYLKHTTCNMQRDLLKRKKSSKYFIDFLCSFGFNKSATSRMCKVLERLRLNSIYSLRKTTMTVDQLADIRGVGKTLCNFYENIQNKFRDCYGK